jgi:hypothetical protein
MTSRVVTSLIENCLMCPLLENRDGFADSTYLCPHTGKESSNMDDSRSIEKANEELAVWFSECTKWPMQQGMN